MDNVDKVLELRRVIKIITEKNEKLVQMNTALKAETAELEEEVNRLIKNCTSTWSEGFDEGYEKALRVVRDKVNWELDNEH